MPPLNRPHGEKQRCPRLPNGKMAALLSERSQWQYMAPCRTNTLVSSPLDTDRTGEVNAQQCFHPPARTKLKTEESADQSRSSA